MKKIALCPLLSLGLAHALCLAAPGDLDTTFNADPHGPVFCSTVQPDGKVVIGGRFYNVDGQRGLARLNLDGSLDSSFENSYIDVLGYGVDDLATQSDGRMVVVADNYVRRVSANGSLDNSFHSPALIYWVQDPFPVPPRSARGGVESILSFPDDRSLVWGRFDTVDGVGRTNLALLERDGALGPPLVPAPAYPVASCVAPGGKFLVAHELASSGALAIWRFNPDGSQDTSFVSPTLGFAGGLKRITALTCQTNGRILVGGGFTSVNTASYTNLARLQPDGSVDPSFHSPLSEGAGDVSLILVQPDGRVLIFGAFTEVGDVPAPGMARLEPDGSPDLSFHWSGLDEGTKIMSSCLSHDGKLFITGNFASVNGIPRRNIARLLLADRVPAMLNCRFEHGQFTFDVTGEPERTVVAEASIDLQVWTPFSTNVMGTNPVPIQDKNLVGRECFYRLKNP